MKTQIDKPIKHCNDCNCELVLDINWTRSGQKYSKYICRDCYNKSQGKYTIKWKEANLERVSGYRSKRRGLGDTFLFNNPFPKDIPVVGHHISDAFEVYLPESLHLNHLHGSKKQLHRDELKPYIESIYNISYIIEEGDDRKWHGK